MHNSSGHIATIDCYRCMCILHLVVLSLDFKSLCMWKSVAELLFQRRIAKDKLGERGGEIGGHIGTKGLGAAC